MTSPVANGQKMPTFVIFFLMIASLVLVSIGISVPAVAEADGDFQYSLISNGSAAEITGYTGSGGAVIIPGNFGGIPVISIGAHAFAEQTSIVSLAIPDNITYIGEYAFYGCSSLTEAVIPSGINVIRESTFSRCFSLLAVQLPEKLVVIDRYAFEWCDSLYSISIPENVSTIGTGCFIGCSALTEVDLPDGLLSLGESAFVLCSGLTEVAIPQGLTHIPADAFSSCSNLERFILGQNVTTIGDRAFSFCGSLLSVSIPENVEHIGSGVFSYCSSLTSIEVDPSNDYYSSPEGVLYDQQWSVLKQFPGGKQGSYAVHEDTVMIESESFGGSHYLDQVHIGAHVTDIGKGEFSDCPLLTSIDVDPLNPKFASLDGVLFNKGMTELLKCPSGLEGDYSVPENVVKISDQAFQGCKVRSVHLPESVTSIGELAFYQCSDLQKVNIPEGVEVIETSAFSDCRELTNVTIPSTVKEIGYHAFMDCNSLTYLIIPDSVIRIRSQAFWGCDHLRFVVLGTGVEELGSDMFTNCQSLTGIYFRGDAPQCEGDLARSVHENLRVHHLPDAEGFTGPWMGFPTAIVSEAPSAPQGLEAEPLDRSIRLTWAAPNESAGGELLYYIVYRNGNAISGPIMETSFTVKDLNNWDKSTFEVTACNIAGESPASNEVEESPNPVSEHLPLLGRIGTIILIGAGVTVVIIFILVLVITFARRGI